MWVGKRKTAKSEAGREGVGMKRKRKRKKELRCCYAVLKEG